MPAVIEKASKACTAMCMWVRAMKVCDEVAEKLRRCEKYEITLQGDDYTDKECPATNVEALTYAKAAAAVMSITKFTLSELLSSRYDRSDAIKMLLQEPAFAEFQPLLQKQREEASPASAEAGGHGASRGRPRAGPNGPDW